MASTCLLTWTRRCPSASLLPEFILPAHPHHSCDSIPGSRRCPVSNQQLMPTPQRASQSPLDSFPYPDQTLLPNTDSVLLPKVQLLGEQHRCSLTQLSRQHADALLLPTLVVSCCCDRTPTTKATCRRESRCTWSDGLREGETITGGGTAPGVAARAVS